MKHKATIVILSPRFPFPLEKGDKLRLFHQIKRLHNHFSIDLISLTEDDVLEKHFKAVECYCNEIHLIKQKKFLSVRAGIQSFSSNKPLQESYYYSVNTQTKINELLDKINPDCIFVQLVRMAKYVENTKIPKLLDYMDAMSLNMKREAKNHSFPLKYIYSREAKLLKKSEKKFNSIFESKIIISNQDKDYLEKNGVQNLIVQSNGVDLTYFDQQKINIDQPSFDLVFVGNMGYLPNVEAVEFLVNDILKPHLPTLRLLIAGARPHNRVKKLESDLVEASGWVEDIRESYLSAEIVIAPIFSGAGQQNKVLEAMSLGRACITTPQVNAAIGAQVGKDLLIAESAKQFVELINYLLSSNENRTKIGRNARIFVEQNFEWDSQVDILIQTIKNLIKSK